jgi:hypothetical protein
MADRRTLVQRTFRTYQKADRRGKSAILDGFIGQANYSRAYAAMVLRKWDTTGWTVGPRGPLRFVAGRAPKPRRPSLRIYGEAVREPLIRLWYLCDCMCGKRLVPAIRALLPVYQRWGEIKVGRNIAAKLLSLSAATADRLLRGERKRQSLRGGSHTRAAPSILLRQIPIRTFDEWDRSVLGQIQADLVGHDGGLNLGDFAFTCTVTELSVGWSELRPLPNKARVWVKKALQDICSKLPFSVISLGTDSGSEFINGHLLAWCQQQGIQFTRTRPYRKNDNCYVEEKNNSLVRRTVGYLRYDNPRELALLAEIYKRQTLLSNYFYPWMKLVGKSRRGARVYRCYDTPRTPYQRLLEREDVAPEMKQQLQSTYKKLNPAALKRELTRLQNKLYRVATAKPAPVVRQRGKSIELRAKVS